MNKKKFLLGKKVSMLKHTQSRMLAQRVKASKSNVYIEYLGTCIDKIDSEIQTSKTDYIEHIEKLVKIEDDLLESTLALTDDLLQKT